MPEFFALGLDIESSGLQALDNALLSLGAKDFDSGETFYGEIDYQVIQDGNLRIRLRSQDSTKAFLVDVKAMEVNNLLYTSKVDPDRIQLKAFDEAFSLFLRERIDVHSKRPIPLGLNVGSFDMAFIQLYLPKAYTLLGFRVIDLSTLYFSQALALGKNFSDVKSIVELSAKAEARRLHPTLKAHNALFDAATNCEAYKIILEKLYKVASLEKKEE